MIGSPTMARNGRMAALHWRNTAAIQVAYLAGAGPIHVSGSSDEKHALARDLAGKPVLNP